MNIAIEFNLRNALRWLLSTIFLWAALSKLANLVEFYAGLLAYRLPLPDFLLRLTTTTLPWLELLCGLMLLARFRVRAALGWTLVLCLVFVAATGQAWSRGLEISCGCLDLGWLGLAETSGTKKLLESVPFAFGRALVLVGITLFLLRAEHRGSGR